MKRILFLLALVAFVFAFSHNSAHADNALTVIQAQGNGNFADFTARANKRADLRLNTQMKGVDVAFSEWLRAERPSAYSDAVKGAGLQSQKMAGASSCCNEHCTKGTCCKGATCSVKGSCCAGASSCCTGKTCNMGGGCKADCCTGKTCAMPCCKNGSCGGSGA